MICSQICSLTLENSIFEAKTLFSRYDYYSLPVIDRDKKLIGAIKIKDILSIKNDKELIASYVVKNYISVQKPCDIQELLEQSKQRLENCTEIFVTDHQGNFVDILAMHAIKNRIYNNGIMSSEQYLEQISQPSIAKSILDNLEEGIVLIDKDSLIVYANDMYGYIIGVPIDKVIGRYLRDIEPNARLLNVLKTAENIIDKIVKVKIKGHDVVVSATMTPIKYREELIGAISIFSDITKITNIVYELEKSDMINSLLTQEIKSDFELPDSFKRIVGDSLKLRKQLNFASKITAIDSPVLILGESGTGKELLAKAIHEASPRKEGPFISINCSAIPENLLETELFGYDDGAFTGARRGGKMGKFEQADGGTLFLDEIGDMPLSMQTKLLRFLQDKELNKVGGMNFKTINVRVLSATNKSLVQMVENKEFREDLYYRINVFTITIPPLRERRIDILNTIEYYKKHYESIYHKTVSICPACLKFLLSYNWPGNVREIKNVIENVVVMSKDLITVENLPDYLKKNNLEKNHTQDIESDIEPLLLKRHKDNEKKAIVNALLEANNNKSKAMEILKISRRTFYKKLKEYNIE